MARTNPRTREIAYPLRGGMYNRELNFHACIAQRETPWPPAELARELNMPVALLLKWARIGRIPSQKDAEGRTCFDPNVTADWLVEHNWRP